MPVTRIADVFVREVYDSLAVIPDPRKLALLNSGVVVSNPALLSAFVNGGKFITFPRWKPLDVNLAPNMSDDDPARMAVPNKVSMTSFQARKAWLNQGFSEADLVAELAGASPMQHVRNSFGRYWDNQWQLRLIATCMGLLAENKANGNSDMVIDKSAGSAAGVGPANRFTQDAFIDAMFTLGDAFGELGAIAVHSMIFRTMVKQNQIVYIKPSEGSASIPTYMGAVVVVDDSMPVTGNSTDGYKYVSIMFGRGAIGAATGTHGVPSELERSVRAANGGGVTSLWERKTMAIHPFGYNWNDADITDRADSTPGFTGDELSPTAQDLAKAANWTRVYPRKSVPLAFLVTNA